MAAMTPGMLPSKAWLLTLSETRSRSALADVQAAEDRVAFLHPAGGAPPLPAPSDRRSSSWAMPLALSIAFLLLRFTFSSSSRARQLATLTFGGLSAPSRLSSSRAVELSLTELAATLPCWASAPTIKAAEVATVGSSADSNRIAAAGALAANIASRHEGCDVRLRMMSKARHASSTSSAAANAATLVSARSPRNSITARGKSACLSLARP
mmetsp:Transcript_6656/g.18566  ORF Transcript_6656/g.18566 Transcript_6656/m.18566 type:complete len:211 (-) Transcript_6656:1899-2531(-)